MSWHADVIPGADGIAVLEISLTIGVAILFLCTNVRLGLGPSVLHQGIHSIKHTVLDSQGTELGAWRKSVWGRDEEKASATRQNVHIAKQRLRKTLLSLLQPGTVQWGSQFVSYKKQNGNVSIRIQREDSKPEVIVARCLVRASGFWSQVRAQKLPNGNARCLGCLVVLGIASRPDHDLTRGDTVFQTGDGQARVYAMPFSTKKPIGNDQGM